MRTLSRHLRNSAKKALHRLSLPGQAAGWDVPPRHFYSRIRNIHHLYADLQHRFTLLLRRETDLLIPTTLFVVSTICLYFVTVSLNDGHFVYSLDDAYIHLAIAKNTTLYGDWGVNRHEFTSSTSSPFYTSLLVLFFALFGVHAIIPLLLNIVFGCLCIFHTGLYLRDIGGRTVTRAIALIVCVLVAPLVTLVFVGMEHTLHLWLLVVFSRTAFTLIRTACGLRRASVLAALVIAARYESLFVVFALLVVLLLNRRFAHGILLGVSSVSIISAYGVIVMWHGWPFLPVSLLLKGSALLDASLVQSLQQGGALVWRRLQNLPDLAILLIFAGSWVTYRLGTLGVGQLLSMRTSWD